MEENAEFGSNPGNLGMYSCVPRGLAKSSALVVALHGGQQTARDFDLATGWSALGRKHGFAVMFPEQKCANNSQNCFNWFIERHVSSNDGEIASIRAMVEKMLRDYKLDRSRVFVTGLSAGGAMACALLASYPDLFAAGAIIAGLPYGAALGQFDAMMAMAFAPGRSSREWGNLVRQASQDQKNGPKFRFGTAATTKWSRPPMRRPWSGNGSISIKSTRPALRKTRLTVRPACRGAAAQGPLSSSITPSTEWLMACRSTRKCVARPDPSPLSCSTPEFRLPFTSPNHGDFCGRPPRGPRPTLCGRWRSWSADHVLEPGSIKKAKNAFMPPSG